VMPGWWKAGRSIGAAIGGGMVPRLRAGTSLGLRMVGKSTAAQRATTAAEGER